METSGAACQSPRAASKAPRRSLGAGMPYSPTPVPGRAISADAGEACEVTQTPTSAPPAAGVFLGDATLTSTAADAGAGTDGTRPGAAGAATAQAHAQAQAGEGAACLGDSELQLLVDGPPPLPLPSEGPATTTTTTGVPEILDLREAIQRVDLAPQPPTHGQLKYLSKASMVDSGIDSCSNSHVADDHCDACPDCDDCCVNPSCRKCVDTCKRLKRAAECGTSTTKTVTYTMCQVRRHATRESCWLVANKRIYDVTTYLASGRHPGGAGAILKRAGQDATKDFKFHPKAARGMWERYKIGIVAKCASVAPSRSPWKLSLW